MSLQPKNWTQFQHYKDRSPPWIKLHRQLLDNIEYHLLTPLAGKCLPLLWILASEKDGTIPPFDEVAFRLRISVQEAKAVIEELCQGDFLVEQGEAETSEQDATPAQKLAKANGFGSRHISDQVKRTVWDRDGGKCTACGSTENIEYDHKVPVSKGGNSEETNIQLLCRPCNRSKRTRLATQPLSRRSLEREGETQVEAETELSSLRSERDVSHAISDDWPKDYREQFWDAYPRKVGRKAAYAKLKIIRASGEVTFAKLIAAVRAIRAGEPRFIPHATTWLNRGGWDDDPAHGGFSGFGGSRPLQDDSRSVSRALDRLGTELEQGTIEFAPRPRLVQDQGEGDLRLLPPGRGTGS